MAKALVIFLHGVGSNGDDLAPIGRHWATLLPDVIFASPNAPERFTAGFGWQWFSLEEVTPENRPGRVRAARAAFDTDGNWEKRTFTEYSPCGQHNATGVGASHSGRHAGAPGRRGRGRGCAWKS